MLEGEEDLQTVSGQNLGHHLKIAHLATNPDNIRAAINSEVFSRVEGSGTALVSALAQKCLRRHAAGIYLESVESAVPFYEKLGFVQLDRHEIRMLEGGAIPMQLTAEKIERLFHTELSGGGLAATLSKSTRPLFPCCC